MSCLDRKGEILRGKTLLTKEVNLEPKTQIWFIQVRDYRLGTKENGQATTSLAGNIRPFLNKQIPKKTQSWHVFNHLLM